MLKYITSSNRCKSHWRFMTVAIGLLLASAGTAGAEVNLPEVRTGPASELTATAATLNGRIKQFEYVDGPSPRRTSDKEFRGGVLLDDGRIVLVPRTGQFVGEYDPATGTILQVAEHGQTGGFGMGSVIDGHTVIMTPRGSRNVGIYDARTRTYRDGAEHGHATINAFLGSAKVADNLIVFGPLNAEVVGLYDPTTDTYTDGPEHGESGRFRFSVITLSTKTGYVVFTPFDSAHVGVYDPATNTYIRGPAHHAETPAYSGSAEANDGIIVMAPRRAEHVGLYDPATNTLTKGPRHEENLDAFMAAVRWPDGQIIMAPFRADNVGVYNPATGEYRSGPSVAHVEGVERGRFSGAVLTQSQDEVVMTNREANVIGIIRENRFFDEVGPATVFFQYRAVGESPWRQTRATEVSKAASFSQPITGLEPSTTYEYRSVIHHGERQRVGEVKTFATAERP